MKVIAVDDEPISLDCIEVVLENMEEIDKVYKFSNATDTINWLQSSKIQIDAAFLDIEMWGKNGLALAADIRIINPKCKIIFVTCNPKYALDAIQLHANGYIMKPVSAAAVRKELDYMQTIENKSEQNSDNENLPTNKNQSNKLKVKCFGNFEVSYKNKNIHFNLSKSKELLAYLVHRKGANCSVTEIASVIFESRCDSVSLQSQVRNVICGLKKSLEEAGIDISGLISKTRGYIAINPDKIECDYYDFLNGNPAAINQYNGEYMAQYSWSEFTVGYLERQINK